MPKRTIEDPLARSQIYTNWIIGLGIGIQSLFVFLAFLTEKRDLSGLNSSTQFAVGFVAIVILFAAIFLIGILVRAFFETRRE